MNLARRIPDGYVSRTPIRRASLTFPNNDPKTAFTRPTSFRSPAKWGITTAPMRISAFSATHMRRYFGALRACEARVRAFFRTVADDMDRYAD